jgi:long-chain acyl-CoA synthetase
MSPDPTVELVHAPLALWAQARGTQTAIRCGDRCISFSELHQQMTLGALTLADTRAPASLLVDTAKPIAQRLVDFLAIVASGRCAVVGDPDWPIATRDRVRASLPQQPFDMPVPQATTPFYVGYTSGSTGTPKGYRRHHRSWTQSFKACLEAFGPDAAAAVLAPGRDSHSLFLFGMLLGLWTGGGVEVQEQFSVQATFDSLHSGRTPCLIAVPSQLLMLIEAARRQPVTPMDRVRLILISGARWSRSRTPELRALFPQARIIEFYGASETSFVAWMETDEQTPPEVVGRPFANVELQFRAPHTDDAARLIYVRSPMVFTDYIGGADDATAALRDADWICVRDLGYLDADGRLCVVGRHNRMLVTLGKNLFPEEVESVLQRHPSIASASVHGLSDPVRGLQVVAIIRWSQATAHAGTALPPPDALALKGWCRQHLEGFKVPRRFLVCDDWRWTPSGKTDHRALAKALLPNAEHVTEAPCLNTLP